MGFLWKNAILVNVTVLPRRITVSPPTAGSLLRIACIFRHRVYHASVGRGESSRSSLAAATFSIKVNDGNKGRIDET